MPVNEQGLRPLDFYRSLPKIDLHRHLEGSIRLSTLFEIAREHNIDLPHATHLRDLVQIQPGEEFTFANFLSKFQTLRLFFRSQEVIERLVMEAVEDAALDNVRYLELRFTPVALSRQGNYDLGAVMDWVIRGAENAEIAYGVKTRLIASVNRHEGVNPALEVLQKACERRDKGILGMDLAGNEAEYDGLEFSDVFRTARQEGLHTTIHAGEWGPAINVLKAITDLGAERIGHGVRILEDPTAVKIASRQHIPFEVCMTSNFQSGVVRSLDAHPLPEMLHQGLNITVATDDPSISQIRLSYEYKLFCEDLGFTIEQLKERVIAAGNAAFLPAEERQELIARLITEFQAI